MKSIGVVGGGAWGTALALTARRAGRDVVLWAREASVVEQVNAAHVNSDFLPGVELDPAIRATANMAEVAECDAVLLVSPAQHLRAACRALAPHWRSGVPAVICAKGIELATCALMQDALAAELPTAVVAVLSGPTFAIEVARGLPTAITLACADAELGRKLVEALGTPSFRPYWSDDLVGSQVGGAVKNVLAIACGIVEGRGLGDNARAALITRGLAELTRLAMAKGGRPETLMGLSGLGDLILTASSTQSRNYSLGFALGQGRALADILGERRSVTEGVTTAGAVMDMSARLGVDMPICAGVDAVINKGVSLDDAIRALLSRPFRSEGL
ncbi:glycerol-3-phosphate acyltransferase [Paramagnetospirillum marisnigri]|uniref:Glycerol-3-phosphate dehydrogenase [NAD(P)+] n=1 Tax=Paramagnetospirillum marisnigri TaxID=1285242 RepID=A0A178MN88_9PROT|nr:NAD(P)H-dependent glycerol-3-phosphate dehydrogenase [Paramagnetospirillum marisnigri]OAN50240.1 glycerol-3-phosphate acyltransferase [Paramagnetospirillum marisnigri]